MSELKELFQLNVSTLFLLHPLGLKWKELLDMGFINAYMEDVDHPEYDEMVLVLFKVRKEDAFRYFVDGERERTSHFIDEYDHEGGYVVLVYDFPLPEDLKRVREGKYSQLSAEYRKTVKETITIPLIPPRVDEMGNVVTSVENETMQWMVINKMDSWKVFMEEELGASLEGNDEYWMAPGEREILVIEKIREND